MTSIQERSEKPLWWLERSIKWELRGTGYTFVTFGHDSVGVQGDARVVGPSVILKPPINSTAETGGQLSTALINKVRGITRVLIEIEV